MATNGPIVPYAPRMATLDIVQAGDPVLRRRADPIDPADIGSEPIQALIASMWETMEGTGVGLAAPQVGVSLQVFVMGDHAASVAASDPGWNAHLERGDLRRIVAVNPSLELVGDELADHQEGCLSVSGFKMLVVRSRRVRLSYLDEHGEPQVAELSGWPARIAQHEHDHLQGTLCIDRMEPRSFTDLANASAHWDGRDESEIRATLDLPPPTYRALDR